MPFLCCSFLVCETRGDTHARDEQTRSGPSLRGSGPIAFWLELKMRELSVIVCASDRAIRSGPLASILARLSTH